MRPMNEVRRQHAEAPAREAPEDEPASGWRVVGRLSAVLAGVALLVLGNGLQGTLVGVRAGLEGMAATTIGFIMSAYFVGFVLGSLVVPHLIMVVGHIRAFAALASLTSVTALLLGLWIEPAAWAVLRAVHGLGYAGLVIVVESWLNALTQPAYRGSVLAIYGVVLYGAWALSQWMLQIAAPSGIVLFCVVSICLSLSLVPVTVTRAAQPGVVMASRLGLRRLYAISPLGLAGAFTVGLTSAAFWGMGPTFAQAVGLNDQGIATFLGVMVLGALALQWPLGSLSDRVDRRWVIVGASLASVAAAAGLVLGTAGDRLVLFALSAALGGFLMPLYSLCVAHTNDQIGEGEVIAAASGLIMVFGIGSMIGPFAASVAMDVMGPDGLFVFIGGAMLALAAYGGIRIVRTRMRASHAKDSYVSVPQTSHAALPLHKHGTGRAEGEPAPR